MELTRLLAAWGRGNLDARDQVFAAVYDELRHLAGAYLRRERPDDSLPPTGLVHEAYFKLVEQRRLQWQNRHHFFGIAAQAMRRILVDRARARLAEKRGGRSQNRPLQEADLAGDRADADVLAVEEALARLEAVDPRQARLVELRHFAGLSVRETAAVLGVSPATVKRDWSLARAWLYRELFSVRRHAGHPDDAGGSPS